MATGLATKLTVYFGQLTVTTYVEGTPGKDFEPSSLRDTNGDHKRSLEIDMKRKMQVDRS